MEEKKIKKRNIASIEKVTKNNHILKKGKYRT